jgi:predicted regulator of Ras-like GTPase activity (Roadblock/LC7/MglB family)
MTIQSNNLSKIRVVLRELISRAPGMEASAVISRDGLSTAAVLGDNVDADQLGAMCAALLGLADTTANELKKGKLKLVLLDGENGILLLVHIGHTHVLALSANPSINLGLCLREAKKSAETLQPLLA